MISNPSDLLKLNDKELEVSLTKAVGVERTALYVVLIHINEVEKRKLHLKAAYSNMRNYLIGEKHYSGSAADRRIAAARILKEVPVVAEKIKSGNLNLTQMTELSRSINEKERTSGSVSTLQKEKIVAVISGKNGYETQKEIAVALDLEIKDVEKSRVQKDASVRLEITLCEEQHKMFLECKDLASSKMLSKKMSMTFSSVFEVLAEEYLKNKKRHAIANTPNKVSASTVQSSATATTTKKTLDNSTDTTKVRINKTLTPKMRAEILQRDQCCQFVNKETGKMCESTFNLQVDHKTSRWADGNHAASNLQALCRAHNNLKYQMESNLRLF